MREEVNEMSIVDRMALLNGWVLAGEHRTLEMKIRNYRNTVEHTVYVYDGVCCIGAFIKPEVLDTLATIQDIDTLLVRKEEEQELAEYERLKKRFEPTD